jgi:hypothetical protein
MNDVVTMLGDVTYVKPGFEGDGDPPLDRLLSGCGDAVGALPPGRWGAPDFAVRALVVDPVRVAATAISR